MDTWIQEPDARRFVMQAGGSCLRIVPRFAFAERNGGWLRWRTDATPASRVEELFEYCVREMAADLIDAPAPCVSPTVAVAHARVLPHDDDSVSAVITSPPYPNRHDYTRIFALELLGVIGRFVPRITVTRTTIR